MIAQLLSMIEESQFKPWYGKKFSLLHVIQTGPGANPTSYSMGAKGSFLVGKAVGM
jgi:hypothetical protein